MATSAGSDTLTRRCSSGASAIGAIATDASFAMTSAADAWLARPAVHGQQTAGALRRAVTGPLPTRPEPNTDTSAFASRKQA